MLAFNCIRQRRNLMELVFKRSLHFEKRSKAEYHLIRTGELVLLPPNSTTYFSADQVIAYGEAAVRMQESPAKRERERDGNKVAYLRLRNHHLNYAEGLWCSVANQGNFIMLNEDPSKLKKYLFAMRDAISDFNLEAAYINCIGRECLVDHEIDDDVAKIKEKKVQKIKVYNQPDQGQHNYVDLGLS